MSQSQRTASIKASVKLFSAVISEITKSHAIFDSDSDSDSDDEAEEETNASLSETHTTSSVLSAPIETDLSTFAEDVREFEERLDTFIFDKEGIKTQPVILDLCSGNDIPYFFAMLDYFDKFKYVAIDTGNEDTEKLTDIIYTHLSRDADFNQKEIQLNYLPRDLSKEHDETIAEIQDLTKSEKADLILLGQVAVGPSDNKETYHLLKGLILNFIPKILASDGSFQIEAASRTQTYIIQYILIEAEVPYYTLDDNNFLCGKAAQIHLQKAKTALLQSDEKNVGEPYQLIMHHDPSLKIKANDDKMLQNKNREFVKKILPEICDDKGKNSYRINKRRLKYFATIEPEIIRKIIDIFDLDEVPFLHMVGLPMLARTNPKKETSVPPNTYTPRLYQLTTEDEKTDDLDRRDSKKRNFP